LKPLFFGDEGSYAPQQQTPCNSPKKDFIDNDITTMDNDSRPNQSAPDQEL
ncbi:hypothetical protein Tco_0663730, partial [Tanacetum coccineum]